jgi:hypothetical protein
MRVTFMIWADIRSTPEALPLTMSSWPRTAVLIARSVAGVIVLPVERTHMVASVGASPLRRCAAAGVTAAPQPSRTRAVSSTLPAVPVKVTLEPSGIL